MTDWTRVKWSEARQILSILDWPEADGVADPVARPKIYFDALRSSGRLPEAVSYLGQALPRLEAVAWAARAVQDLRNGASPRAPEAAALKAALLWVQDPSENRRRAAFEAAERCEARSAERMAALAAFFSGGSVAPPDCPPVPAARDTAGRLASGAVLIAATAAPDMNAALQLCLDAGEALAANGVGGAPA
jgi:hypothetical protein